MSVRFIYMSLNQMMLICAIGLALAAALPQTEAQWVNSTLSSFAEIPVQHMINNHLPGSAGRNVLAGRRRRAQETHVVSGFYLADSDYYARIRVGGGDEYYREFYLAMDTGSHLTWIQCQPCYRCFEQLDPPIFEPGRSSTLDEVSGDSPLCARLPDRTADEDSLECTYKMQYADGETTSGRLVTDTFTLSSGHRFPGLPFGCSDSNSATNRLPGAAGLLGLSRGLFSFPSLLRHVTGHHVQFSFCLPRMFSPDSSTITFGAPVPPNTAFTGLIVNNYNEDVAELYYVRMTGISVGALALRFEPLLFDIDERYGTGGVFIDSGLTNTILCARAYNVVRDTFKAVITASARQLRLDRPYLPLFDTCYYTRDGTPDDRIRDGVPSITLHFAGDAQLVLPPELVLIPLQYSARQWDKAPYEVDELSTNEKSHITDEVLAQIPAHIFITKFRDEKGDSIKTTIISREIWTLHKRLHKRPEVANPIRAIHLEQFFRLLPWGIDYMRAHEVMSSIQYDGKAMLTDRDGSKVEVLITTKIVNEALHFHLGMYDLIPKTKSIDNEKAFLKVKGSKFKYSNLIYSLVEANLKNSSKNNLYMSDGPMLTRIAYQALGMIQDLPAAGSQASLIQQARYVPKAVKTTSSAASSRTTRSTKKSSSDDEITDTDKDQDSDKSDHGDSPKGAEAKGPFEYE
ncbi:hypothetical protein L7F22_034672 [Adiantum nelumboides]|nr:hypothetical protein [Adiantum nelumboides]